MAKVSYIKAFGSSSSQHENFSPKLDCLGLLWNLITSIVGLIWLFFAALSLFRAFSSKMNSQPSFPIFHGSPLIERVKTFFPDDEMARFSRSPPGSLRIREQASHEKREKGHEIPFHSKPSEKRNAEKSLMEPASGKTRAEEQASHEKSSLWDTKTRIPEQNHKMLNYSTFVQRSHQRQNDTTNRRYEDHQNEGPEMTQEDQLSSSLHKLSGEGEARSKVRNDESLMILRTKL